MAFKQLVDSDSCELFCLFFKSKDYVGFVLKKRIQAVRILEKRGDLNSEINSSVYMTCINEAKKDLREGKRPELKSMPESIDEYDTIVLGYPNYWGTMPMAVVTFLENFDFTGKTMMPKTHGMT